MSGEGLRAIGHAPNPHAAHTMAVPTMPIATDNGMGRIERPSKVPRSELEAAEQHVKSLQAQIAAICQWTEDEDGAWDTDCGESFQFEDGGPEDNKTRFCCYCGGRLAPVHHAQAKAERLEAQAEDHADAIREARWEAEQKEVSHE